MDIIAGVCNRCGQAFCVEKRRGVANTDDPTAPLVIDKACRICECIYSRNVVVGAENA